MRWLYLVGFQAGWWAAALGAANGMPWLGVVAMGALVVVHLARTARRREELLLVVAAGVLGYAADSALVLGGMLSFPEAAQLGGPSPLWMVAMWMGLAATITTSLSWMVERPPLGLALGVLTGPLAYRGGDGLGALHVEEPALTSLLAIAVVVGALCLALSLVARATRPSPRP